MAIAKLAAKAAAKKTAKKAAKGAAKKSAPKAAKKAPAAKAPATNAVGMRFDMGAGASVGSAAPARSSFIPGKAGSSKPAGGAVMAPKAAAARVGKGTAAGMVPVQPFVPRSIAPKTVRKVGAAVGSVAITGGVAMTADQKQRQLVKAAKYRK